MDILEELQEQANELIHFGDSKEKATGQGMLEVLGRIGKYVKAYREYDAYFDSISDEEKEKLHQTLEELGMYEQD